MDKASVKVNFREFLEDHGVLGEYLRNTLSSPNYSPDPEDPGNWLLEAFDWGLYDSKWWSRVDDSWRECLMERTGCRIHDTFGGHWKYPDAVEPGLPIGDKLGLSLVLAEELEDEG